MPDPDLEISGGGELSSLHKDWGPVSPCFSALQASVWSENKGGPPLDPPHPGICKKYAAKLPETNVFIMGSKNLKSSAIAEHVQSKLIHY